MADAAAAAAGDIDKERRRRCGLCSVVYSRMIPLKQTGRIGSRVAKNEHLAMMLRRLHRSIKYFVAGRLDILGDVAKEKIEDG